MSGVTAIGGWGIAPSVLSAVFGERCAFVDPNPVMPGLVTDGGLTEGWVGRLAEAVVEQSGGSRTDVLAGWSMGAIAALAVAPTLKPSRLVLLSPTPSFCRREGWRFGLRPAVLRSMRTALDQDTGATMRRFLEQCGWNQHAVDGYAADQLCAGLVFLEQVSLLPLERPTCDVIVVHGTYDVVIPVEAGRYVAEQCDARLVEVAGPHAFFTGKRWDASRLGLGDWEQ